MFQIWQSSTFRFAGIGLRPGENLQGAEKQKKKHTNEILDGSWVVLAVFLEL